MKDKDIKIIDLQNEINESLKKFCGNKYKDMEYHSWYCQEIKKIFDNKNITEMKPAALEIILDVNEQGMVSYQEVAKIRVDNTPDKRCKDNMRGTINSISVIFRDKLLNLTLSEARKVLFKEVQTSTLEILEQERISILSQLNGIENHIDQVKNAKF